MSELAEPQEFGAKVMAVRDAAFEPRKRSRFIRVVRNYNQGPEVADHVWIDESGSFYKWDELSDVTLGWDDRDDNGGRS